MELNRTTTKLDPDMAAEAIVGEMVKSKE